MKKNNILDKINCVIPILVFAYMGFRCGMVAEEYDNSIILTGICLLNIAIAMFIHAILHELGHLIGGLITGYKFTSFRIGEFALTKGNDGKLYIKKMKINGTMGQCLMCPPNVKIEDCPYKIYNLSGGLVNIVLACISLIIYMFLPKNIITFALLEEFSITGLVLGCINLLPSKAMGIPNDGLNIIELGKNIEIKKYYILLLKINALLSVADSYSDLPRELVEEIKSIDFSDKDLTNTFICNVYLVQASIYYSEYNYEKYYEIVKKISYESEVLEFFKNEAKCECLFCNIIEGNTEEVEKLYDKNLQKYIKITEMYPSRLRLMYAYNLIILNDLKKANEYYLKLEKSVNTYIIKCDAILELKVVNDIKEKYNKT